MASMKVSSSCNPFQNTRSCVPADRKIQVALLVIVAIGALTAAAFGLAAMGHHMGWWSANFPPLSLRVSTILLATCLMTAGALTALAIHRLQLPRSTPTATPVQKKTVAAPEPISFIPPEGSTVYRAMANIADPLDPSKTLAETHTAVLVPAGSLPVFVKAVSSQLGVNINESYMPYDVQAFGGLLHYCAVAKVPRYALQVDDNSASVKELLAYLAAGYNHETREWPPLPEGKTAWRSSNSNWILSTDSTRFTSRPLCISYENKSRDLKIFWGEPQPQPGDCVLQVVHIAADTILG